MYSLTSESSGKRMEERGHVKDQRDRYTMLVVIHWDDFEKNELHSGA